MPIFNPETFIASYVEGSASAVTQVLALKPQILEVAEAFIECSKNGGVIYACGNGGSACEAIHLVEELVARYLMERPGIRSQHLMDASTITCWANDYDFASAFKRQVETFLRPVDILVAFSTSGNSENILLALEAANKIGAETVLMGGKDGGKAKPLSTYPLIIPTQTTSQVQEAHMVIVHLLCHIVEQKLFPPQA